MRHQLSRRLSSRHAFTLVELLVVVVIIAILVSLAIPVTNTVMRRTNELRTKAVMKDLEVAITNFRAEYNRLPIATASSSGNDIDPIVTDDQTPLIAALMAMGNGSNADAKTLNPRWIKFIDLAIAKNGQSFGVILSGGANGNMRLVDIWGMPYRITLDTNLDNSIANPDKTNSDQRIASRASEVLPRSIGVQCLGPDKIINTRDDIVSWR